MTAVTTESPKMPFSLNTPNEDRDAIGASLLTDLKALLKTVKDLPNAFENDIPKINICMSMPEAAALQSWGSEVQAIAQRIKASQANPEHLFFRALAELDDPKLLTNHLYLWFDTASELPFSISKSFIDVLLAMPLPQFIIYIDEVQKFCQDRQYNSAETHGILERSLQFIEEHRDMDPKTLRQLQQFAVSFLPHLNKQVALKLIDRLRLSSEELLNQHRLLQAPDESVLDSLKGVSSRPQIVAHLSTWMQNSSAIPYETSKPFIDFLLAANQQIFLRHVQGVWNVAQRSDFSPPKLLPLFEKVMQILIEHRDLDPERLSLLQQVACTFLPHQNAAQARKFIDQMRLDGSGYLNQYRLLLERNSSQEEFPQLFRQSMGALLKRGDLKTKDPLYELLCFRVKWARQLQRSPLLEQDLQLLRLAVGGTSEKNVHECLKFAQEIVETYPGPFSAAAGTAATNKKSSTQKVLSIEQCLEKLLHNAASIQRRKNGSPDKRDVPAEEKFCMRISRLAKSMVNHKNLKITILNCLDALESAGHVSCNNALLDLIPLAIKEASSVPKDQQEKKFKQANFGRKLLQAIPTSTDKAWDRLEKFQKIMQEPLLRLEAAEKSTLNSFLLAHLFRAAANEKSLNNAFSIYSQCEMEFSDNRERSLNLLHLGWNACLQIYKNHRNIQIFRNYFGKLTEIARKYDARHAKELQENPHDLPLQEALKRQITPCLQSQLFRNLKTEDAVALTMEIYRYIQRFLSAAYLSSNMRETLFEQLFPGIQWMYDNDRDSGHLKDFISELLFSSKLSTPTTISISKVVPLPQLQKLLIDRANSINQSQAEKESEEFRSFFLMAIEYFSRLPFSTTKSDDLLQSVLKLTFSHLRGAKKCAKEVVNFFQLIQSKIEKCQEAETQVHVPLWYDMTFQLLNESHENIAKRITYQKFALNILNLLFKDHQFADHEINTMVLEVFAGDIVHPDMSLNHLVLLHKFRERILTRLALNIERSQHSDLTELVLTSWSRMFICHMAKMESALAVGNIVHGKLCDDAMQATQFYANRLESFLGDAGNAKNARELATRIWLHLTEDLDDRFETMFLCYLDLILQKIKKLSAQKPPYDCTEECMEIVRLIHLVSDCSRQREGKKLSSKFLNSLGEKYLGFIALLLASDTFRQKPPCERPLLDYFFNNPHLFKTTSLHKKVDELIDEAKNLGLLLPEEYSIWRMTRMQEKPQFGPLKTMIDYVSTKGETWAFLACAILHHLTEPEDQENFLPLYEQLIESTKYVPFAKQKNKSIYEYLGDAICDLRGIIPSEILDGLTFKLQRQMGINYRVSVEKCEGKNTTPEKETPANLFIYMNIVIKKCLDTGFVDSFREIAAILMDEIYHAASIPTISDALFKNAVDNFMSFATTLAGSTIGFTTENLELLHKMNELTKARGLKTKKLTEAITEGIEKTTVSESIKRNLKRYIH